MQGLCLAAGMTMPEYDDSGRRAAALEKWVHSHTSIMQNTSVSDPRISRPSKDCIAAQSSGSLFQGHRRKRSSSSCRVPARLGTHLQASCPSGEATLQPRVQQNPLRCCPGITSPGGKAGADQASEGQAEQRPLPVGREGGWDVDPRSPALSHSRGTRRSRARKTDLKDGVVDSNGPWWRRAQRVATYECSR